MNGERRILLLEDEALLRVALTRMLAGLGYRVIAAASPEACEAIMRQVGWDWPDVVLADANLCREPDLFLGYGFFSWWRARFPLPAFVFMHGHAPIARLPGAEGVRVCHILKPIESSELMLILGAITDDRERTSG